MLPLGFSLDWGDGPEFGVGGLQFVASPFEPLAQLVGVGENTSTLAAGNAVDGQGTLLLPTTNGALVAAEEGSDFLPRIKALIG